MPGNIFYSFFRSTSQHHQIQLAAYCLPFIRLLKGLSHYTFTLKMAAVMLAETLDNSHIRRRSSRMPKLELEFCYLNSSPGSLLLG
jgi:hypothetical protein